MAEDKITDHNQIKEVISISYFLKTLKLIIIILNFSYILGMFWVILCKAIEDFFLDADYTLGDH